MVTHTELAGHIILSRLPPHLQPGAPPPPGAFLSRWEYVVRRKGKKNRKIAVGMLFEARRSDGVTTVAGLARRYILIPERDGIAKSDWEKEFPRYGSGPM